MKRPISFEQDEDLAVADLAGSRLFLHPSPLERRRA
jgi:hypothetical protein